VCWQGLRYGVLGLGDSVYYFYQQAAIQIDRLLEQLGGSRILPRGAADDMAEGGLEEGVDEWHSVRTCVCGAAALFASDGSVYGCHGRMQAESGRVGGWSAD
jgi:sulfite reductase alpha subunit-like flavoprotein